MAALSGRRSSFRLSPEELPDALSERFENLERLGQKIVHADGDVEAVRRRTMELMGVMADKDGEIATQAKESLEDFRDDGQMAG